MIPPTDGNRKTLQKQQVSWIVARRFDMNRSSVQMSFRKHRRNDWLNLTERDLGQAGTIPFTDKACGARSCGYALIRQTTFQTTIFCRTDTGLLPVLDVWRGSDQGRSEIAADVVLWPSESLYKNLMEGREGIAALRPGTLWDTLASLQNRSLPIRARLCQD